MAKEMERVALAAAGANGRRLQARKPRADGWTKAKRSVFLDMLAVTCNVHRAAAAAGIATTNCYALKRRDPEFAALWSAALEAGYEHIETQLLARTIGQNPTLDEVFDGGTLEQGTPEQGTQGQGMGGDVPFDPDLALRVLAQRDGRGKAGRRPRGPVSKRVPIEQVCATLLAKLDALDARLKREAQRALPAPAAPAAPAPAAPVPVCAGEEGTGA